MKSWLLAVTALACCAGAAHADSPGAWSFTAVAENDGFIYSPDHTDRYYTDGTQVSATSPAIPCEQKPWLARVGLFLEKAGMACTTDARALQSGRNMQAGAAPVLYRWGIEAGQNAYTPATHYANPDPKDHPYAGWTYGGVSLGSYSPKEANTLELQVGMVGPSSGSAKMQGYVHKMVHAERFLGWDHQLEDEPAFVLLGERRWAPHRLLPASAPDNSTLTIDSTDHLDFAIGTVQDSVSVGRTWRAGFGLDADYGPPRIRPAPSGSAFTQTDGWSAYVFAGLDGRAVARNIFLDGNTFRTSPHVEKRWFVGEATGGVAVRWRGLRLGYAYVWQSEEFVGQKGPQKFGSWSLTLTPFRF